RPLFLPPPLPARPPVPPPYDVAEGRPALRVIIFGGIIYTRENMGNVRDAVNDNIRGDVRNAIENCNPKEYDRKGGVVVYTRWIEVIESVQDMSGYGDNQKVKYTAGMSWDNFKVLMREEFCPSNEMQKMETELCNHTMVVAGHAAYTDRFHELARLVPHLVTPENKRIESTLTDEAMKNKPIKKNHKKRGNGGEPSNDRNERDDNKRTMTGNAFATTTNPIRREKIGGNYQNQVVAINGGQGHENNDNQAHGRAFMLGAEEACQDPNIVTGIEPCDLGFSYEIEIASGQLIEIDKVIKGCKLEIEGYMFDINLIPFGSESFDMIIGMDSLSNHKAEIIC
nr:reverse transcriptase domain-containing protein [Tanacetum cinerariifolium]